MDASIVVLIVVGAGLVTLIVLAAKRMARKRPAVIEPEEPEESTLVPEVATATRPAEVSEVEERPSKAKEETGHVIVLPVKPIRPFRLGLERTRREGFIARLKEIFGQGKLDESIVSQVEEVLLTADVGVKTANILIDALRNKFRPEGGDIAAEVMRFLKHEVVEMLAGHPHGLPELVVENGPAVIMVVGVNGTGKTTNIGKLAHLYKNRGRRVLLAAGDTYRAAGADQLVIWGERVGVPVVSGKQNADPASVIFEAAKKAKEEGYDLLIADTAGRLHTNINLVEELKKVHRVIGKAIAGAPHEVLLMLDATMGQNAIRQADIFRQAVSVTGVALAKLDGSAKGGVILSIVKDLNLPVRFVGVGEGIEDLKPFDPEAFAEALFEND